MFNSTTISRLLLLLLLLLLTIFIYYNLCYRLKHRIVFDEDSITMEFRIFIPDMNNILLAQSLSSSSVTAAATAVEEAAIAVFQIDYISLEVYNGLYNELLQIYDSSVDIEEETRTDEYIVGKSYYGLKKRGTKSNKVKYEIKVLQDVVGAYSIQKWKKTKLGSSSLSSYTNRIAELLTEASLLQPDDVDIIENHDTVTLTKHRKIISYDTSSIEICKIRRNDTTNSGTTTKSSGDHAYHGWLSVSIESNDSTSIEDMINSNNNRIISIVKLLLVESNKLIIIGNNTSSFANASHLPALIDGYPMFVYLLHRNAFVTHAEMQRNMHRHDAVIKSIGSCSK